MTKSELKQLIKEELDKVLQEYKINIEYGVGETDKGWIPLTWMNGKSFGHTYYEKGWDRDIALKYAKQLAQGEAEHYVGDWDITITPRGLQEKSVSQSQQQAAGAALSAKRGERGSSTLKGASKQMYDSMSEKELEKFASTKHKGLPSHASEDTKEKS